MLLVFGILLVLYATTAPRTVAMEDDGLFILAACTGGIAHPPGYPLHTLISGLLCLLPVGTAALRVHLASSLLGAGTCAVLFAIIRRFTATPAALVGALSFGVSAVLWSQSIIAEVYTLNTLLFFALLAMCLRWQVEGGRRLLGGMALVYGLSLTNHWPLIALSSPALLAVVWPRRRALLAGWRVIVPALLVGLLPYAWMVIRSQADPAISFYGPIRSLSDLWYVISRAGYSDADPGTTLHDKLGFLGFLTTESLVQFTPVGALLGGLGLWKSVRTWPRHLSLALILAAAGSTVVLVGLLGFENSFLRRAVFRVYPLIAYGVGAIWLSVGLGVLADRFHPRLPLVGLLLPFVLLGLNVEANARQDDTWADDYGRAILESLPPDTILLVHGDIDTGAIGYLHHIEGVRPDVTLTNSLGLVFTPRLFSVLTHTPKQRQEWLLAFIESSERPVAMIGPVPPSLGTDYRGLYNLVLPTSDKPGIISVTTSDGMWAYFDQIEAARPVDAWTRYHRHLMMGSFGAMFTYARLAQPDEPQHSEGLERAKQDDYGGMSWVRILLKFQQPDDIEAAWQWTEAHHDHLSETFDRRQTALFFTHRAHLLLARGDSDASAVALRQAVRTWPDADNVAIINLLEYYAASDQHAAYRKLRAEFFATGPVPDAVRAQDEKVGL